MLQSRAEDVCLGATLWDSDLTGAGAGQQEQGGHSQDTPGRDLFLLSQLWTLLCQGGLCWQGRAGEELSVCNQCNTESCRFYSELAVVDQM